MHLCFTAPCVMLLMRVASITVLWQVGGGWALEIESFLGPVKWHRADRRVPFRAKKKKKTRTFLDFFSFRLISSSTCRAHKEL
jgi:hypothetical protein